MTTGPGHDRQFPVLDEMTGEVVSDPDGLPIGELAAADYLGLADTRSIEELAAGERAWRFGHVIVDEAQDLTPMQWRMVARRARGHSMTIVGDLAQRSAGSVSPWADLLPSELGDVPRFDLTTNYRSPSEIADLTAGLLAELAPDLEPPVAIRSSGYEPTEVDVIELARELSPIVEAALAETAGRVAVIGVDVPDVLVEDPRLVVLTPRESKGMEFDWVIVIDPDGIRREPGGLSLLYVALTRSTERLTIIRPR